MSAPIADRGRLASIRKRKGLNRWERVERFLFRQVGYEFKRSADIVGSEIVLTLNFLESHPPCQAADDYRHGQAGTSNHGFTVNDGRVQDDSIQWRHRGE